MGTVVERDGERLLLRGHDWDELFRQDDLTAYLDGRLGAAEAAPSGAEPLAPVIGQEIWAAGVTYYRSRDARMAESEQAGGGSFYDRVYTADRPELFCKGSARTVVAPSGTVRIRADSAWNVPEPELTLAIDRGGRIFGYTIGNDMSSRDIEGENPLYLPQAKTYDGSCALGSGDPGARHRPRPRDPDRHGDRPRRRGRLQRRHHAGRAEAHAAGAGLLPVPAQLLS